MLEVSSAKCTRCSICVEECRSSVLVSNKDEVPWDKYPERCNICGHCVAICPTGALRRDDFSYELFKELSTTIPVENVRDLLLSRRSVGVFKEQSVPKEMIEQLIFAGTHAGTASNEQSESYIVIQDKKILSDLEEIVLQTFWDMGLKYMGNTVSRRFVMMMMGPESFKQATQYYDIFMGRKKDNQLKGVIFRSAPVVIISCGLKKSMPITLTNCALALRNMEIMALPMGLGTCWSGFLMMAAHRNKKVARLLHIPDTHNIYGAIMVGFPKYKYKKMIPRKERTVRWI